MDREEIWTSSSSAERIRELDIARLLQHAASSLQLLRVAHVDTDDDTGGVSLPEGEERSELFVQEATAYFQTLDALTLRRILADVRTRRITPSSINAPPPNFVPPTFGSGPLPNPSSETGTRGGPGVPDRGANTSVNFEPVGSTLQEARVERDAWRGIAETLSRMRMTVKVPPKTEESGVEDATLFMDHS
ncbi:hypothetical protein BS47DRAFT_1381612 [Hydnum rufescens UP504]|uniref:Mediator complex subunit 11 n=1 Tax=Hydnum rufescens UP504 TaxID=1448309 RepID=A0A9P6B1H4_9AGAM|nr:hypothetical protein BS47DRAFT_1381612 [Hydnum rufescens UP504]